MEHVHESPVVMIPLLVLAIGRFFLAGLAMNYLLAIIGSNSGVQIICRPISMENAHHVPSCEITANWFAASGVAIAVLYMHLYWIASKIVAFSYHLFFYNKWYFDELYDAVCQARRSSW